MRKLILAFALIGFVIPFAAGPQPAYACTGSVYHDDAQDTKPIIAFDELSAAQRTEIERFQAEYFALSQELKSALHAEKISRADADKRMEAFFKEADEKAQFRTTKVVGDGMLCGAKIEIAIPPSVNDIKDPKFYEVGVYGKNLRDSRGGKALGVFYPERPKTQSE